MLWWRLRVWHRSIITIAAPESSGVNTLLISEIKISVFRDHLRVFVVTHTGQGMDRKGNLQSMHQTLQENHFQQHTEETSLSDTRADLKEREAWLNVVPRPCYVLLPPAPWPPVYNSSGCTWKSSVCPFCPSSCPPFGQVFQAPEFVSCSPSVHSHISVPLSCQLNCLFLHWLISVINPCWSVKDQIKEDIGTSKKNLVITPGSVTGLE